MDRIPGYCAHDIDRMLRQQCPVCDGPQRPRGPSLWTIFKAWLQRKLAPTPSTVEYHGREVEVDPALGPLVRAAAAAKPITAGPSYKVSAAKMERILDQPAEESGWRIRLDTKFLTPLRGRWDR